MAFIVDQQPGKGSISAVIAELDAKYFGSAPERPVQLRPRFNADLSPQGKPISGEMVLVAPNLQPRFCSYIRPPRYLRNNSAAAVEWAIAWLEREAPAVGKHFRQAALGGVPEGFARIH